MTMSPLSKEDAEISQMYHRIRTKMDSFPDGPEKAWLTCWRQYHAERTKRELLEKELEELKSIKNKPKDSE